VIQTSRRVFERAAGAASVTDQSALTDTAAWPLRSDRAIAVPGSPRAGRFQQSAASWEQRIQFLPFPGGQIQPAGAEPNDKCRVSRRIRNFPWKPPQGLPMNPPSALGMSAKHTIASGLPESPSRVDCRNTESESRSGLPGTASANMHLDVWPARASKGGG